MQAGYGSEVWDSAFDMLSSVVYGKQARSPRAVCGTCEEGWWTSTKGIVVLIQTIASIIY